jgi:hypothetical protein
MKNTAKVGREAERENRDVKRSWTSGLKFRSQAADIFMKVLEWVRLEDQQRLSRNVGRQSFEARRNEAC